MTPATIRPKRNRRAYRLIEQRVRSIIEARRQLEIEEHRAKVFTTSVMSLIRDALNMPLPEEDKAFIDPDVITKFMAHQPDRIVISLKYLNADFTPEKLYSVLANHEYNYLSIEDWLDIRWMIINVVEARHHWSAIPAKYYALTNGDFFFDEARVINTKGQNNHTAWEAVPVPKPALVRPEFPPSPIEYDELAFRGWWEWVKKLFGS